MSRKGLMRQIGPIRLIGHIRQIGHIGQIGLISLISLISLASCYREPPLYLYDADNIIIDLPLAEVKIDLYWDYKDNLGLDYDWRAEWYYGMDDENGPGWDDEDKRIFGELDYVEPSSFQLRSYYCGEEENGSRIFRREAGKVGRTYRSQFEWGYWDLLAWNDIITLDNVQSLRFNEPADINEPVTATTGPNPMAAAYRAPRADLPNYEPEQLFAAYEGGIGIHRDLRDFVWNEKEGKWMRELNLYLQPITYIYLPQIILRNNYGRIIQVPGLASLTGMAAGTTLNTGIADTNAVSVAFAPRMKKDKNYKNGEKVDIIGGRLMTFGTCGQNANRITRAEENEDTEQHFLQVPLQYYNGYDSLFVFDVTEQVRRRYKGGVITVVINVPTDIPPPPNPGKGFNAEIVGPDDGGTWEFDM